MEDEDGVVTVATDEAREVVQAAGGQQNRDPGSHLAVTCTVTMKMVHGETLRPGPQRDARLSPVSMTDNIRS